MKSLPPLKSLQVFLCAAQSGSFKAAAEQLFVSQAAVSQQIRLLEQHVNCKLFERESKHTRLSAKGELLLPYIEQAFEQINSGIHALSFEPYANSLRITALHSITSLLLIPKIHDFQQQYPQLSIQFSPNNRLDSFNDTDIDIAIRRGLGSYPGLESRKLIDDAIMLVACPRLLPEKNPEPASILDIPLLEDTSSDIEEAVADFCLRYQVKRSRLNARLKTTDAVPIIQNVLAGRGMAFVSKVLAAEHIKNGNLVNVLDYAYITPKTLYLVAPAHHFHWQKIKRFEAWLKALLQNHMNMNTDEC
ncbi:LysR substrate-binding domain-containing protein [Thalassomonas haliotis]|uniref:LysR family transcriptional regulator n=1 Tax=Thalassomonas haliotis TaxID=485448 RepID=A0ABY7V9J9_9GAMM|nr:LysR substrate-binding domain-containing protein [Thalassomonas haliotis]WDE10293.1 LysR family transcriptional regulator [Thalassomonas haliotis]